MEKHIGKVGAISREVKGKPCVFCGGHQYQLRLTPAPEPGTVKLHALCTQCHRQNAIGKNLGEIIWM